MKDILIHCIPQTYIYQKSQRGQLSPDHIGYRLKQNIDSLSTLFQVKK